MEIKQAILHRIDEEGGLFPSDKPLDLNDATIDFLEGHIQKIGRNTSTKEATFVRESAGLQLMQSFIQREIQLLDLSMALAKKMAFFVGEFSEVAGGGFLVCEYTVKNESFLFICKLPYGDCFVQGEESDNTQIIKTTKMLPSHRSHIKEACICPFSPMVLQVLEESLSMDGEWLLYFSKLFLEATVELSQKEVVNHLTEIHEDMAIELSEKPFDVSQSLAKWSHTVLLDTAENEQQISVHSLASRLFPTDEERKDAYLHLARNRGIKEDIPIQKSLLTSHFSKQIFQTSSGVQIRLPVEMVEDDNQVEFVYNDNGSVTIMLKNLREKTD